MADSLLTTIAGTEFKLFAQRAAYCESISTLFIADTHFGKDATFRRHGFPVPAGGCQRTLDVISELLQRTEAQRLIILGDMFHAKSSLSSEILDPVERFFECHRAIEFLLVQGNHDSRVGRLPKHWPMETVPAGTRLGTLALGHEPSRLPPEASVWLCGHLHPAFRPRGLEESVGKLPCFWYHAGCLVFPAIGSFTGTHIVKPRGNDRVWLIADREVIEHR